MALSVIDRFDAEAGAGEYNPILGALLAKTSGVKFVLGTVSTDKKAEIEIFLPIDISHSESYSLSSSVTNKPVESGTNISDNIVNDPMAVTLECSTLNNPVVNILGSLVELLSSAGVTGGLDQFFTPKKDDALSALNFLREIRDNKFVMTLVSPLMGVLPNMVMTHLEIPVTAETGDRLHFTISLQQVSVVVLEDVDVPPGLLEADKIAIGQGKALGMVDGNNQANESDTIINSIAFDANVKLISKVFSVTEAQATAYLLRDGYHVPTVGIIQ